MPKAEMLKSYQSFCKEYRIDSYTVLWNLASDWKDSEIADSTQMRVNKLYRPHELVLHECAEK